jgi:hypothetical protein
MCLHVPLGAIALALGTYVLYMTHSLSQSTVVQGHAAATLLPASCRLTAGMGHAGCVFGQASGHTRPCIAMDNVIRPSCCIDFIYYP